MSFASNKSPIRLSGVSRGRIVVGGGFKNGGFSMYGSSPKRRTKSKASKTWYESTQNSLSQENKQKQREESKMIKMKEDLELRRAIRHSRGKYEDTKSMEFTQAKINRYNREVESRKLREEANNKIMAKLSKWYLLIVGAFLLTTSLWWVYVTYIVALLIRRRQRANQAAY